MRPGECTGGAEPSNQDFFKKKSVRVGLFSHPCYCGQGTQTSSVLTSRLGTTNNQPMGTMSLEEKKKTHQWGSSRFSKVSRRN